MPAPSNHNSLNSPSARRGIVREVNCLGIPQSELAKALDRRFANNARACQLEFESGRIEPGKLFVFDAKAAVGAARNLASESAPVFFNLPTRVHSNAPIKQQWLEQCIEATMQAAITQQVYDLDVYRFDVPSDSTDGWNRIKVAFLTSFARVPNLRLRFFDRLDPEPLKQVTVFTDGGFDPSSRIGGYGIVLRFGDSQKELSQGFRQTSSNRMELMAVVVALEALKEPCKVLLHSDSRFIIDSVNTGTVFRWRQKNWKNRKDKDADLWERFVLAYARHDVEMLWVKGHAGVADNERCDLLATQSMKANDLSKDTGYVPTNEKSTKRGSPKNDIPAPKTSASMTPAPKGKKGRKPKHVGDPCRDCGRSLIRRKPKKSNPNSSYYFEWYLYCETCKKLFHVEEAKVYRNQSSARPKG